MNSKSKKILLWALLLTGLSVPIKAEKLVLEGSTTVLPIAQKAAEIYMQKNPNADISVRGGGSGVGITSLIDGACDIANSSRQIKESELEKARNNGRNITAHLIAMDGIAIIINPANTINGLTKSQVKDIYIGKINNWEQVGGENKKIVVISRDSASGTYEAFGELVLNKSKVRRDALMQASNQAILNIVAKTPHAIGYIGAGFVNSAIKEVPIDGISPTKETVLNKKYSISRPLFMYTGGQLKGLTKSFIIFVKSTEGQKLVEEEGFFGSK